MSENGDGLFGTPAQYEDAKRQLNDVARGVFRYPPAAEHQRNFLLAAIRRTLSIEMSFLQAVESRNGQMAMTLVRLNLDTVARLYALYWADKTVGMTAEIFAERVAHGEKINSMKLRGSKQKATDAWLISQIEPLASWIPRVYRETSGAIHFSDFHVSQLLQQCRFKGLQEDGSLLVELELGPVDRDKGFQRFVEVRQAFLHITLLLITAVRHRTEVILGVESDGDV